MTISSPDSPKGILKVILYRNNLVRALTVEHFPVVSSCRMLASSISLSLARTMCTSLLPCSFVPASDLGDGSEMESPELGTTLLTKVISSDVLSQSTDCFRPEESP